MISKKFNYMARKKILIDKQWHFCLADEIQMEPCYGFIKTGDALNDIINIESMASARWRLLDLPHDWVVELPFSPEGDNRHGFKDINTDETRKNSVGWYRKKIFIPDSDEGKRINIEFDGVFRDSIVWLNGHYISREASGYIGFSYDITDYVMYGKMNTLVVRVDASQYEGWFYEGAGIYRHVWLTKTAPVYIRKDSIHITYDVLIHRKEAEVTLKGCITNDSYESLTIKAATGIFDMQGNQVASTQSASIKVEALNNEMFELKLKVNNLTMWSVDNPHLYKARTEVILCETEEVCVDSYDVDFGIRTFHFDPDKGFFLNGLPLKIKGMCCHQDHAGVGIAIPDGLQWYRISKLKEMGCNAIRTSHNPPSPELLDACDRLGMLVMDEQRLMGSSPEAISQLERLILRDRNRACVFSWSIGNEEMYTQSSSVGKAIALSMKHKIQELDGTRKITYAGNNGEGYEGINSVIDIRGWNYILIRQDFEEIDRYHSAHPEQPVIGTEEASVLSTRGVYVDDLGKCHISSYNKNIVPWGATPEEWWSFYDARDYIMGGFAWTGFDYRGEPTPFSWPCICSHYGTMDLCGFPKDNYYYYKAWWTDQVVLHILPHWNWHGMEGKEIKVVCYSNCEEVELFLNGNSIPDSRKKINKNSTISWMVRYEPGCFQVVGYKSGKEISKKSIYTTGKPCSLSLKAEYTEVGDICVVTVSSNDINGRHVPDANDTISFEVTGNARIIGVGNGDPSCLEADRYIGSFTRRPLLNWETKRTSDNDEDIENNIGWSQHKWLVSMQGNAKKRELWFPNTEKNRKGMTVWRKKEEKAYSDAFTLYRTRFNLSETDMNNGWGWLSISIPSGKYEIYVNNEHVYTGEGDLTGNMSDIRKQIKTGENSIVIKYFNNTSFNKNTNIVLCDACIMRYDGPRWTRSLFNGLCCVIIEKAHAKQGYEWKLSAKSSYDDTCINGKWKYNNN